MSLFTLGSWASYFSKRNLVDPRKAIDANRAKIKPAIELPAELKQDLPVRLHLIMEENWQGQWMLMKRARLAGQLLSKAPHDAVQEDVIEFFESLAALETLGLVNRELTWGTFSFHASRWWTASEDYIFEKRRLRAAEHHPMAFTQFELFAERLKEREAQEQKIPPTTIEPGVDEINRFLRDELELIRRVAAL